MQEVSTDSDGDGDGDDTLPFSQAIESGDKIYVSGQGPLDPESREVTSQDPYEQTLQTFDNIERILAAANLSLDDIVKATVYLTDMDAYERVNEAYGSRLTKPYPARTCVEVSRLPVDIIVEIDVIAERTDN